ncbi:MAG: potassium transporter TrkG [SAR202 cluster bacterium]|nr:potassium transporter TrkG [SAR202 cluster bacterium]MDP6301874.1 potassium transporter TrkG [SAR202 cluster bacterium]MDP7105205.1 potassium transporter TrkG [SAR202 cluster bacterium]MDP7226549.1 potassium transporter TrkG [SAR202 cluster bacterium]
MRETWEPKPGDRVIRHPRQEELEPVRVTVEQRRVQSRAVASPLIIIYTFAALIAIGTVLLSLPFTHVGGGFTPFMVALFTSTSAVTVTGLVVRDTAAYWTTGGQAILLALMFVGGLGFMTLATFLLILIGQRVTLTQRLLIREGLGVRQLGGLVGLSMRIVALAVGIQIVGFVALAIRFWFLYDPGEALWQAAFHAVSGFNNGGFIIFKEEGGTAAFKSDGAVIGVIMVLTILGGLSYAVMVDVAKNRKFTLLGLNTKLVLIMTPLLLALGMGLFLAFEYQNAGTLGDLSVGEKLTSALFESVNTRSGGFSVVDYTATKQHTNFIMTSFMFVGGASASVAGGIKINTAAVVLVAVLSTIRGRAHASAFGREIAEEQVRRALVVGAISTVIVFVIVLLLVFTNSEFDFLSLLFDAVSAFGTVGLSTGITEKLSASGQFILVIAMFVGRIGPFALGLALTQRSEGDRLRFAQEHVTIG